MECKELALYLFTRLTRTSLSGSDGCIASWIIWGNASQGGSGVLWMSCHRRLMRRMNAPCERSMTRTGNLPSGYSYALPWPPAPYTSRNWRSFLHLISERDLLWVTSVSALTSISAVTFVTNRHESSHIVTGAWIQTPVGEQRRAVLHVL